MKPADVDDAKIQLQKVKFMLDGIVEYITEVDLIEDQESKLCLIPNGLGVWCGKPPHQSGDHMGIDKDGRIQYWSRGK